MKILAIVGSLRKESYNYQLAQAAKHLVNNLGRDVELEILDWSEVPLFNQDEEFPPPFAVEQARNKVQESNGIWIFTPEYNHSYPGALKNLLDWLSRPVNESQGQVLSGKPVAFCGASTGMSGTSHAHEHLIPLLSFLNMPIMNNPRLTLPYIAKQTDDEGKLALDTSTPYLARQAEAFIDFISHHHS